MDWNDLERFFPKNLDAGQLAAFKTAFYKRFSLEAHRCYRGKLQLVPKVPLGGLSSFNVWYTPGVSAVSTAIRDDNDLSFALTGRANRVAIVSDSTRVLGDGDCTPFGGLGVMEGKALLMSRLAGIDAVPLCVDNRDEHGAPSADKVIDFVKMIAPSFGAVNLEDISQPNCFKILDVLGEECPIPVWHDDAQGTACVVLAGLLNALKVVGKDIRSCKIVLYGAGAANTAVANLLVAAGASAAKMILFDSKGTLHKNRFDYRDKPLGYRQWRLCLDTNEDGIMSHEEAFLGADVLIALSNPGPDTVRPEWIGFMAEKPVVFACANPVPEIYPYEAEKAGAFIVATGRGDFPNQINNSLAFPSVLKGVLVVSASKITDSMAIAAAHAIAGYAEKKGLSPQYIIPTMLDTDMVPLVASEVAAAAVSEGIARNPITKNEVKTLVANDIEYSIELSQQLSESGLVKDISDDFVKKIVDSVAAEYL
ncbi:MAG: NADP-dependent malic enzyme [Bacteroidales bacterium]|nr:NADP-dependent malic enzyme [Bacteroidales bacterium]